MSSDIKIEVADTGTLDFSQADAMEAFGVGEQRYAAAQQAAEMGLDPTALTDPPDLYGPGVVPPSVQTADGPRSRGLVVPPPVSSIDLPLPTDATDRSVDPDVGGSDVPPPAEEGDGVTRPNATGTAPGGSSAGVVVRPDPGLTLEEQAGLGLIDLPGGWADQPPVQLPDLNAPGGRPVDPDEFDPNRAQLEEPFVVPVWDGLETVPDRPEVDLENDVWTFPLLPDESPVDAEPPKVEPTPSPLGVASSPAATFASPVLQSGVPFTAGDTGWSSVAVKNPQAVQPVSTATEPVGDITWSSQKATQTYTPPAGTAVAPVTTPVAAGWSRLRAQTPSGWRPSTNWPPTSTSAVKKPAVAPVTAPVVKPDTTSAVRSAGAESASNPLQQFTDFVGGAGAAINENVVVPTGNAFNSAGKAFNEKVWTPAAEAYQRADADARERMSRSISSSTAVDGFFGFGATRYRVEIQNGTVGVYDSDGRLLSSEKGSPPVQVSSPGLYTGNGGKLVPAAPGSVRMPVFVR